jgi:hypothetical protein
MSGEIAMRLAYLVVAAAFAACPIPASAQDSDSPRGLMESLGMAPSKGKVRKMVAKAEREPLGSAKNPIRTSGPAGERAYIARLRCADGTAPKVGIRGSVGTGPFGTIMDVYPLDCGESAPGAQRLFMDMYHEGHVEDRAAPGFNIVP